MDDLHTIKFGKHGVLKKEGKSKAAAKRQKQGKAVESPLSSEQGEMSVDQSTFMPSPKFNEPPILTRQSNNPLPSTFYSDEEQDLTSTQWTSGQEMPTTSSWRATSSQSNKRSVSTSQFCRVQQPVISAAHVFKTTSRTSSKITGRRPIASSSTTVSQQPTETHRHSSSRSVTTSGAEMSTTPDINDVARTSEISDVKSTSPSEEQVHVVDDEISFVIRSPLSTPQTSHNNNPSSHQPSPATPSPGRYSIALGRAQFVASSSSPRSAEAAAKAARRGALDAHAGRKKGGEGKKKHDN